MYPSCSKLLKGGQENRREGEQTLLRRLLPRLQQPKLGFTPGGCLFPVSVFSSLAVTFLHRTLRPPALGARGRLRGFVTSQLL